MGSAVIWSGALQAAATLLVGQAGGAQWGIDQPGRDFVGAPTGQKAGTAARVVELAAQIIMELPDDSDAVIRQANEAARQWLDAHGR